MLDKKNITLICSFIFAVLLLCIFIQGCREDELGLVFSHKFHTETGGAVGAECSQCHETNADGKKMTLPNHEQCSQCHEINESDPPDKCSSCHTREDNKVFLRDMQMMIKDVKFYHKVHIDLGFGCLECHPEIKTRDKTSVEDIPEMEVCSKCHRMTVSECSTCHDEIREGRKPIDHTIPVSHDSSWKEFHGRSARTDSDDCLLCHKSASCEECHTKVRPSSHSLSWKQDIHGRYATQDRDKCAVCHQADFCSRCHEQRPTTHYEPDWVPNHRTVASRDGRSCVVCHEREFCQECHRINFKKLVK
ncbi:MAG: cytochrome c3 family protein [Candidatus Schekmanbacteria bacterium]|nr:cytochrome c3 family protein [Candidatus Schekmanbacteria bacterium]